MRTRFRQEKLYLNPEVSQVALQLLWVLKVNGMKPQLSRTLQIQWTVIYKDAPLGRTLRNFDGHAKNVRLWITRINVAGTKKDQKITPEIKRFDPVFVQLKRLVIDCPDKVLL